MDTVYTFGLTRDDVEIIEFALERFVREYASDMPYNTTRAREIAKELGNTLDLYLENPWEN